MVDRYTRVVLTVIAAALCVIAFQLSVKPAQAQGPTQVEIVGSMVEVTDAVSHAKALRVKVHP